jgi:hypothetical protein
MEEIFRHCAKDKKNLREADRTEFENLKRPPIDGLIKMHCIDVTCFNGKRSCRGGRLFKEALNYSSHIDGDHRNVGTHDPPPREMTSFAVFQRKQYTNADRFSAEIEFAASSLIVSTLSRSTGGAHLTRSQIERRNLPAR